MEFLSFPLPLGLMYLASVLEKNKKTAKILDALIEGKNIQKRINNDKVLRIGLEPEQIIKKINDFRPDLIGVTNPFSV